jgi:hypothetical protein
MPLEGYWQRRRVVNPIVTICISNSCGIKKTGAPIVHPQKIGVEISGRFEINPKIPIARLLGVGYFFEF